MSDTNPDLAAQEVDDELRRDQLNALWKAYGKYVIGGAVGIVLTVGGTQLYKYQVRSSQESNSAAFSTAAARAGAEGADVSTVWKDAASKLGGGYAALAEIRAADALIKAGDFDAAIQQYDALASSSAGDELLRQYAQLAAAMLVLDKRADLEDARARFTVLSGPGQPWRFNAIEQLGYIDMTQGEVVAAYDRFAALADDTAAPPSLSLRARQLRDMLEGQLPNAGAVDEVTTESEEAVNEG